MSILISGSVRGAWFLLTGCSGCNSHCQSGMFWLNAKTACPERRQSIHARAKGTPEAGSAGFSMIKRKTHARHERDSGMSSGVNTLGEAERAGVSECRGIKPHQAGAGSG